MPGGQVRFHGVDFFLLKLSGGVTLEKSDKLLDLITMAPDDQVHVIGPDGAFVDAAIGPFDARCESTRDGACLDAFEHDRREPQGKFSGCPKGSVVR